MNGDFFFDTQFLNSNTTFLAGTDEVGRGPLAGPVVSASAAIYAIGGATLTLNELIPLLSFLRNLGVNDSKKLSEAKKKYIVNNWSSFSLSSSLKLDVQIAEVSEKEIDRINILEASLKAMRDSFGKLSLPSAASGTLLIDGNQKIKLARSKVQEIPVVKGDAKSLLIGLASVVAKVYRDELMAEMAKLYPHYGFEKHAGYPTAFHRQAIIEHGPSPIHRLSFRGVVL